MNEFIKSQEAPDTLQVIDDMGNEREIPREDFWLYEWDAQPNPITIDEYFEQNPILKGENNG